MNRVEIKSCKVCDKPIKAYGSPQRRASKSFCSIKCRGAHQTFVGRENRSCSVCDKEFFVTGTQKTAGYGYFCSMYCYGLSKRGPTYKDDESTKIRKSSEYRIWRKQVFERDDYTCKLCGEKGGRLNADHIKPFASYPELRLVLSNGRTLCLPCHYKTPTWGGRAMRSLSLPN